MKKRTSLMAVAGILAATSLTFLSGAEAAQAITKTPCVPGNIVIGVLGGGQDQCYTGSGYVSTNFVATNMSTGNWGGSINVDGGYINFTPHHIVGLKGRVLSILVWAH